MTPQTTRGSRSTCRTTTLTPVESRRGTPCLECPLGRPPSRGRKGMGLCVQGPLPSTVPHS